MINELNKNGYVILKNALTKTHLNELEKSIIKQSSNDDVDDMTNTLINYTQLKYFIDNIYIRIVNETFNWDASYIKFRFSNNHNSNSKDASVFHSDVYNFNDNIDVMPIYTGLCYLDDSMLELIPGSHCDKSGVRTVYNNKKQLTIRVGDILIFHSNLYHRGIFYKKSLNRRILQIFEIFPNKKIYDLHKPKLLTVLTNINDSSSLLMKFSNNKTIINTINYFLFFLVYHDLQYRIIFSDISHTKKIGNYVGYEPGARTIIYENKLQDWNLNVIVDEHRTIESKFNTKSFIYIIVMVIIFVISLSMIYNSK